MINKIILCLGYLLIVSSAQAQTFKSEFSCGEVTIESIKRSSSETVLVRGSLRNTSTESCPLVSNGVIGGDLAPHLVLQDLEGKQEFKIATVDSRPVASRHSYHLAAGESFKFWARMTAPPKELKTVTVVLGGDAMPIENVPVQD
jgi:hypothetical protein